MAEMPQPEASTVSPSSRGKAPARSKSVIAVAIAVGLGVAFAVARYAVSPSDPEQVYATATQSQPVSSSTARAAKKPLVSNSLYEGGCSAYSTEPGGEALPGDENLGEAKRRIDGFFGSKTPHQPSQPMPDGVRFAIALAPDPIHTHLQLSFDREIVAIQQAAQGALYDYDTSWLPWREASPESYNNLADRQRAAILERQRESCPGVLLFRRHVDEAGNANPAVYNEALVVLVVGEQPTAGINVAQWRNAIHWLTSVAKAPRKGEPLRILGPTFSGSFPSLERAVSDASSIFPKMLLLSGSATSLGSITTFQNGLRTIQDHVGQKKGAKFAFGAFNENDELHIKRLLKYLDQNEHTHASDVAVISEDETSYSRLPPDGTGSTPLQLNYPRDISAVRDAYDKQSVFDSALARDRTVRAVLRPQAESNLDEKLDDLPLYGGESGALDQEAHLLGLVDALRAHHIRYTILRATNPLDLLFLSRFFHRAYPNARVVTVGADLLFRRDVETTEFRGSLALSSFSMIAREKHWGRNPAPDLTHHVFSGNMTQGTYLAARYLFERAVVDKWTAQPWGENDSMGQPACEMPRICWLQPGALIFHQIEDQIAYEPPFWLHPPTSPPPAASAAIGSADARHPPSWLTTLGRDGYWTVATLDSSETAFGGVEESTMVNLRSEDVLTAVAPQQASGDGSPPPNMRPLAWKICLFLATLLALYQCVGIAGFKGSTSDGIFFVFHNNPRTPIGGFLRGVKSAFALAPLVELTVPQLILKLRGVQPSFTNWDAFVLLFPEIAFAWLIAMRMLPGGPKEEFDSEASRKQDVIAALVFLITMVAFVFTYSLFLSCKQDTDLLPLVYRMAHITDGVSPLPVILLVTFGFYASCWQAVAGNLFLAPGRPVLPFHERRSVGRRESSQRWLRIADYVLANVRRRLLLAANEAFIGPLEKWKFLRPEQYRLSDGVGDRVLLGANPFFFDRGQIWILSFILLGIAYCFREGTRTFSLEGTYFNLALRTVLLLALLLILLEASHLYETWVDLRRLLLAMNRSRIRRAMTRLQPLSARSLWTVSTNVHRVQYRLFYQQQSALRRLVEIHKVSDPDLVLRNAVNKGHMVVEQSRQHIERGMAHFWWRRTENDRLNIRETFRDVTAYLINRILWDEWQDQPISLYAASPPDAEPIDSRPSAIRRRQIIEAAEEFVCVQYIAFIHNILARMRTMTSAITLLFVSIAFAIALYPFTPNTTLASLLLVTLLIVGAVVAYVYAEMDRNVILSLIAQTDPTRLGAEFWVKLASFLVGPVIGVLATQYPSFVESVLGWVQPGINTFK